MKVVNVKVNLHHIRDLCRTTERDYKIRINGLPPDAVLINIIYDPIYMVLICTFNHDSFDWVHEEQPIPDYEVAVTKIYD